MLSIIISWRDRDEIRKTLPEAIECVKPFSGEVIVVNYSGDEQKLRSMIKPDSALRIVSVDNQKYFNKSSAHNIGIHSAQNDVLFFCDCDVLVEKYAVEDLFSRVSGSNTTFATIKGVVETKINSREAKHVVCFGYTMHIKTADGRELNIVDNEEDGSDGSRPAPGLLFVKKEHILKVSGYNGMLKGWGWEDQDMISRLTLGCGLNRYQDHCLKHLSHDEDSRMTHYQYFPSRWESRDRMFREALSNYDRNDFHGTYYEDIEQLNGLFSEAS